MPFSIHLLFRLSCATAAEEVVELKTVAWFCRKHKGFLFQKNTHTKAPAGSGKASASSPGSRVAM